MATFTTRVELHGAVKKDYDKLHEEMEKEEFSRTIKSGDGKEYHMLEAEYNYEGDKKRSEILDKAITAAKKTGKNYSIMVTESKGRNWYNLDEVD